MPGAAWNDYERDAALSGAVLSDLNPIELSYSAFKAFLRKCAERTEEALRRRIGQFVRRLPAEACANFFAHAGYAAR
jgi:hypothetical protein